ncbi:MULTISPECIES: MFS transporter [Pseudonocardia]|uniref:MFS transporter, DHA1 family, inner membrane transport protein n=1 Tax=Pseudonocardia oroxyli TaxID=366584 RepID=A0A1G7RX02_PSEOR|nr:MULTISPECIES: MFS transporter [Pseudonocardia]MCF7551332.1 MFS transporter [Pseudonocardia sp. WMMC193]SDG15353.1 MFS transporter, DHA1 family, inner membrane transport protein [Pseudonocardia oroxyli]
MRLPLLVLALGAFALGTGEFTVMGLLPQVASDLAISIPQAGNLVSAYAIGVVVGAPLLIAAATRLPRRQALILTIGLYGVAHLLSAVAPNYPLLLVARFLSGLPHGAYFGIAAIVAGMLARPERRARAMAQVFMGLTVANIVGVPLSTLLGQLVGWRWTFALVGVIALATAVAVRFVVPDVRPDGEPARLADELRALTRRPVWMSLAVAVVGGAALFTSYSYIAPMLTEVAGYPEAAITLVLAMFGVGMTVGNVIGARLADWDPLRAILLVLPTIAVVALALVPAMHHPVSAAIVLFLFAIATFAVLPSVQLRIIDGAAGAPHMAAGSMHAAFNLANAAGAWLGGAAIAAGFGLTSPNVVAAALALLGLGIALITARVERRVPATSAA